MNSLDHWVVQKLSAERSRWLTTQSNISRRVIKTGGDLKLLVLYVLALTCIVC